jgi:hypothetical protein
MSTLRQLYPCSLTLVSQSSMIDDKGCVFQQVLGNGYYLTRYPNSALFDQLIKDWIWLGVSHRCL